ncbi:uncharacterized protein LOC131162631 [Malania oleifera]|uniref:uncharacterized protein LOC131162631 n=1 Tax=Malania oleifera TaxID=397392 RepID=UPI0025AD9D7F|nr:uncharacterized protein LOC131162631 [Malania oleifera]
MGDMSKKGHRTEDKCEVKDLSEENLDILNPEEEVKADKEEVDNKTTSSEEEDVEGEVVVTTIVKILIKETLSAIIGISLATIATSVGGNNKKSSGRRHPQFRPPPTASTPPRSSSLRQSQVSVCNLSRTRTPYKPITATPEEPHRDIPSRSSHISSPTCNTHKQPPSTPVIPIVSGQHQTAATTSPVPVTHPTATLRPRHRRTTPSPPHSGRPHLIPRAPQQPPSSNLLPTRCTTTVVIPQGRRSSDSDIVASHHSLPQPSPASLSSPVSSPVPTTRSHLRPRR